MDNLDRIGVPIICYEIDVLTPPIIENVDPDLYFDYTQTLYNHDNFVEIDSDFDVNGNCMVIEEGEIRAMRLLCREYARNLDTLDSIDTLLLPELDITVPEEEIVRLSEGVKHLQCRRFDGDWEKTKDLMHFQQLIVGRMYIYDFGDSPRDPFYIDVQTCYQLFYY
jgi:hypothetical protein